MKIKYSVINQTNCDIKEYKKHFRKILNRVYQVLKLEKDYCLSIIFVDQEQIHQINKDYRNIDNPTDVISFASLDNCEEFELECDEVELGDIFISINAIINQAKEYGHSELREASFLFVHGVLHLLGYDHTKSENDERIMFDLQDEILDRIIKR